jgi:hypothetical protein
VTKAVVPATVGTPSRGSGPCGVTSPARVPAARP